MPLLILCMGGEMVYILEQRLEAQKIASFMLPIFLLLFLLSFVDVVVADSEKNSSAFCSMHASMLSSISI